MNNEKQKYREKIFTNMEEHLKQKKETFQDKIETKEEKMKAQFERTQRQRKLHAELTKIKNEERLEEAKRLEKMKQYQTAQKKQQIEEDSKKDQIIRAEKERIEVRERVIGLEFEKVDFEKASGGIEEMQFVGLKIFGRKSIP